MTDWLSLAEAAALLGVHPSTLRRWSDEDRLPSIRTSGGHRRFDRLVIERFIATQGSDPAVLEAQMDAAIVVLDNEPAPWRTVFQGQTLEDVRGLGQRLLGLLMQFLTRQTEDERFLAESRRVGQTYGQESAQSGLAMLDTVEAFLYFRSHFTQMTIQLPAFPRAGDDDEMRRLHTRIDKFMNEVLLGVIEGYLDT